VLALPDPFDPNYLDFEPKICRVYGDDQAQIEALVDEIDYQFLIRHRWNPKTDKTGKTYLRRAVSTYYEDGSRSGSATVYLHIEVLLRAKGPPPTKTRCIGDHINGDSLDCRRENLRWATKRENNRNRFGSAYYQRSLRV
jgi:hypothetical protein